MNFGEQAYLVGSEMYSVPWLFKRFDDARHYCSNFQTANSLLNRIVRSFCGIEICVTSFLHIGIIFMFAYEIISPTNHPATQIASCLFNLLPNSRAPIYS